MDGKAEATTRSTILDTARQLLNENGVSALSMREVARRAGVTHQAPYHYFTNRAAIIAEVVAEGFRSLAAALRSANDLSTTCAARDVVLASSHAYIDFAESHPGVFRVMFRTDECDPTLYLHTSEAGLLAFAELERLVRIAHGAAARPDLTAMYWAHVHGLATLLIDGPLGRGLDRVPSDGSLVTAARERFADLVLGLTGAPR